MPTSPLIRVGPVFVTVEPASIAKALALLSLTGCSDASGTIGSAMPSEDADVPRVAEPANGIAGAALRPPHADTAAASITAANMAFTCGVRIALNIVLYAHLSLVPENGRTKPNAL